MRLSKQSAPLIDSYDITVSKDELRLIREALAMYEDEYSMADPKKAEGKPKRFHSVHLDDRKQQIYETMTTHEKLKQMGGSIDEIKGILVD